MSEKKDDTPNKGFSGRQVLLFVVAAVLVTAGISFWFIKTIVFPSSFKPVSLSVKEQDTLDSKLHHLGVNPKELLPNAKRTEKFNGDGNLIPEKYTEDPENRQIGLTQREVNAMIANNADLAKRFAVNLSNNLASAKIIIPVDPDFPFLGGKTLRVNAGLELDYRDAKPVVKLRGVSVMGVPIPNAWLGNLKNVDLVDQFGSGNGFWQSLAAGVELIEINDGKLNIKLKE